MDKKFLHQLFPEELGALCPKLEPTELVALWEYFLSAEEEGRYHQYRLAGKTWDHAVQIRRGYGGWRGYAASRREVVEAVLVEARSKLGYTPCVYLGCMEPASPGSRGCESPRHPRNASSGKEQEAQARILEGIRAKI